MMKLIEAVMEAILSPDPYLEVRAEGYDADANAVTLSAGVAPIGMVCIGSGNDILGAPLEAIDLLGPAAETHEIAGLALELLREEAEEALLCHA